MKNNITLEEAMKKLEEITEKMQNDDLPVDEALKLFEEGTKLVSYCREKLDKASLKITELSEKISGDEDE